MFEQRTSPWEVHQIVELTFRKAMTTQLLDSMMTAGLSVTILNHLLSVKREKRRLSRHWVQVLIRQSVLMSSPELRPLISLWVLHHRELSLRPLQLQKLDLVNTPTKRDSEKKRSRLGLVSAEKRKSLRLWVLVFTILKQVMQ